MARPVISDERFDVAAQARSGPGGVSWALRAAGPSAVPPPRPAQRWPLRPPWREPSWRQTSGDELSAVDPAAGCGDGEDQPMVERDVAAGQQRLQQSPRAPSAWPMTVWQAAGSRAWLAPAGTELTGRGWLSGSQTRAPPGRLSGS